MQRTTEVSPLDDAATPVIVCGVLAGLAGAIVGMAPVSLAALIRGEGPAMPAKLVAATLMGREALDKANSLAAALLGSLMTVIAAGAAGALFAWIRRREARIRLLIAEGVGFGLVLFGVVWATLPYLNPVMYSRQSLVALGIAYAMFGATLATQLPLRVGSLKVTPDEVRRSLGDIS